MSMWIKLRPFFSHGLILGVGLCGTLAVVKRTATESMGKSSKGTMLTAATSSRPARHPLSSHTNFRETYREMATRPMSHDERERLKNRVFAEWKQRDPQGLLAFLDKTSVWPEYFSNYIELGDLGRDRPDLLLDFAARNGCEAALSPLQYSTESGLLARMIAALPVSQKGKMMIQLQNAAYQEMGSKGELTATPNAANLCGAAKTMLEEGRLDEFFETFGKIDDESLRRDLAAALGSALGGGKPGDPVFAYLAKLPPDLQNVAVGGQFFRDQEGLAFPEGREERRKLIEKLAANGMARGASSGIGDLFSYSQNGETTADFCTG